MLLSIWTFVNIIGIFTVQTVASIIYSEFSLNQDTNPCTIQGWLNLTLVLIICGAVKGFILAGLQSIVLLLIRIIKSQKVWQLFILTVLGMTIGQLLSIFDASMRNSAILSWILAGALWGAIAGKSRNQKNNWGMINAGAYYCWGNAAIFGWMMLSLVLSLYSGKYLGFPTLAFIMLIVPIVFFLVIGMLLNGLIFHRFINTYSLQCRDVVEAESREYK